MPYKSIAAGGLRSAGGFGFVSAGKGRRVEPIPQLIERVLKEVKDPRSIDVLDRRFGLRGGQPITLEQVGAPMGVTRERARQLLVAAINRLNGASDQAAYAHLVETVVHEIERLGGITTHDELMDSLRQNQELGPVSPAGLIELLQRTGTVSLGQMDIQRTRLVFTCRQDIVVRIAQIVLQARKALRPPIEAEALVSAIVTMEERLDPTFVRAFVRAVYGAGGPTLIGRSRRRVTKVEAIVAVMREADRPLHFTEVAIQLSERFPDLPEESKSPHSVLATLGTYRDLFGVRGRGKYVLLEPNTASEDLPIGKKRADGRRWRSGIADAIEQILLTVGAPLFEEDLIARVFANGWDVKSGSIRAAVETDRDRRFYKVGNRIGLRSWVAGQIPLPRDAGNDLSIRWGGQRISRLASRIQELNVSYRSETDGHVPDPRTEVEKIRSLPASALRFPRG